MKDAILFDISRATDAQTLLEIRRGALADDSLFSEDKEEICAAVHKRFARLNADTKPNRKPRWS